MQNPCLPCNGTGRRTCAVCGGAGASFLSKSRVGLGGRIEFYQERIPCRMCFGTRQTLCVSCGGVGWVVAGVTPSHAPEPTPPRRQGRSARVVRPEPAADQQVFSFQAYQFVYHPHDQNVSALWQHNPGNVLDVNCRAGSTRINVAACDRDMWLSIAAPDGHSIPLAIYVGTSGVLLGRWL